MSRRRTALAAGVTGVLVVALATAGLLWFRSGTADADPEATPSTGPTTTVQRVDLTDRQLVPGTLGFGVPQTVTGRGGGTVTALPAPGAVVRRGEQLYRADDEPVTLLTGGTPFFRKLAVPKKAGEAYLTGNDVAVLKKNLDALGYYVGTRQDPAYTPALGEAVRQWQDDVGLEPTGELDPASAVVLPTAVRVESVSAALGDPADADLMTVTSTARTVSVQLDAVQGAAHPVGAAVTVMLADGTAVPGEVASVGTQQGDDGAQKSVAVIAADEPGAFDDATSDAVRVAFAGTTHEDVLAVPVSALLALAGGGYGVELPDGTLLRVKTGLFADGLVEVSGDGVTDGLTVVDAP